jgi:hypothetical protein
MNLPIIGGSRVRARAVSAQWIDHSPVVGSNNRSVKEVDQDIALTRFEGVLPQFEHRTATRFR